jgi:hypothetical protein
LPVSIVTVTGTGGGVSIDAGPPPMRALRRCGADAAAGAEPVLVRPDLDAILDGLAYGHWFGIGVRAAVARREEPVVDPFLVPVRADLEELEVEVCVVRVEHRSKRERAWPSSTWSATSGAA